MSAAVSQNWTDPQIAVALFFCGSAVVIGLDALKQTGARAKALWIVAVVSVVAAFWVKRLWDKFPDVSLILSGIATWPPSWFILLVGGYLAARAKLPSNNEALDDDRLSKLIEERIAALPPPASVMPDASQFEASTKREIEAVVAIQKTAIEENKATHQLCTSLKKEIADVTSRLDPSIKDLSNQLTALNNLFQPIWRDYQQVKVNATIAELERMKFPLPEVGSDAWQARPIWKGPPLAQTMMELGITDVDRNASNAELKSEIKSDAIYITLQDGDESHWANGNDKRQWHLLNAQFEADIRLLRNRMIM